LRRFGAKRSNKRVLPEISRDKTAVIAPTTVSARRNGAVEEWCGRTTVKSAQLYGFNVSQRKR
jgi:hypothetical protein